MERQDSLLHKQICAVIVSYNPGDIISTNIESLLHQVDKCIIVDNGSTNRQYLETLERDKGVSTIFLENNSGIAHALNVGLKYCYDNSYDYILTMDQDTVLDGKCVSRLLQASEKYSSPSVGINWEGNENRDKYVNYLITSGNLVKVDTAMEIGGYDEKLFIDSVDFDFSLKLADKGHILVKVSDAKAIHNLGEVQGDTGYITHSPERYFYMYRNHFYLCGKYWKTHPGFILKKNLALILDLFKIVIHDRERGLKIRQLQKGWEAYKKMV